jgi:RimJ/RimL family protein N-acetyltransferase
MRRPHLRTGRLALRPLAASDEAALVAGLNDWEVARWLAVVPFRYGPADFRAFLPPAAPGSTWVIAGARGRPRRVRLARGQPPLGQRAEKARFRRHRP